MALTRIDSYLIDLDAIGGIDFDVQEGVPTLTVDETTHRVGVGTDNPNGLLSLSKDSGRLLTLRNSTTGFGANDGSYLALNGSDLQISNAEAADLIVYTNDTERLRITSDGEILISNTTNKFLSLDRTNVSSGSGEFNLNVESNSQATFSYDDGAQLVIGTSSSPRTQAGFSEKLRIDSNGRLGLNSNLSGAAAYNRLVINSPDNSCWMSMHSAQTGSTINSDGLDIGLNQNNDGHIWLRENASLLIATNGTEKLRIESDGRLTSTRSTTTAYDAAATTNNSNVVILNNGAAGHATLQFQSLSGGTAQTGQATISSFNESAGSKDTALTFGTRQSSDATVRERLRITSTGNVGIGTANPLSKLHVANSSTEYMIYTSSGNLELYGPENSNSPSYMRIGASYNQLGLYCSDTMHFNTSNTGGYVFGQDGVGHTYIKANGNVGINEDNPTALLQVTNNSPDPFNTILTTIKSTNSAGNGGAGTRIELVTGVATSWIQGLVDGGNSSSGSSIVFGTPSTGTVGTERLRIASNGQILFSGTSGDNQFTSRRTNVAGSDGDYFFQLNAQNRTPTTVGGLGFHQDGAEDSSRFVVFTRNTGGSNTESLRVTADKQIHFGNSGFGTTSVGGQEITGQNYSATLKVYDTRSNMWGMQIRRDTNTGPNGIFIRAGNTSSNYSLYVCGTNESTTHLVCQGDGNVGIGTNNPSNKLNVTTSQNASIIARFNDSTSATDSTAFIAIQTGYVNTQDNEGVVRIGARRNGNGNTPHLIFYTANNASSSSERMVITGGTGNVGIGTDNPINAKLHISGGASYGAVLRLTNTGTNGGDFFFLSSDNTWTAGSDKLLIGSGSPSSANTKIILTSSGNVGIGLNTPGATLHVRDSDNTTQGAAQIKISKGVGGGAAPSSVSRQNCYIHLGGSEWGAGANGNYLIGFGYTNGETGTGIPAYIGFKEVTTSGYTYGDLIFGTRDNTTGTNNATERLRIRSNGDVILGPYDAPGSYTNAANNVPYQIKVAPYGWQHHSELAAISMGNHSGATGNDDGEIVFKTTHNAHSSTAGLEERLRITSIGNVGIGTTNPSEKLDVEGAINCDAIYGKRFTDSTTVDTGIYVGNTPYYAAIFEVTVSGNPNHYGSFAYRCSSTYMVHIGTGWTGSDVSTIINATRISYGVGGSGNSSEVTASFVLWNGSTEYNSGVARNSSHQLRIKLSGLSTPSGAVVNIKQIHRL